MDGIEIDGHAADHGRAQDAGSGVDVPPAGHAGGAVAACVPEAQVVGMDGVEPVAEDHSTQPPTHCMARNAITVAMRQGQGR